MLHFPIDVALQFLSSDVCRQVGHYYCCFYVLSGPVRGINFHTNQPLFVSGGDDYKIKVSFSIVFVLC